MLRGGDLLCFLTHIGVRNLRNVDRVEVRTRGPSTNWAKTVEKFGDGRRNTEFFGTKSLSGGNLRSCNGPSLRRRK